jgi:hypothetical protein
VSILLWMYLIFFLGIFFCSYFYLVVVWYDLRKKIACREWLLGQLRYLELLKKSKKVYKDKDGSFSFKNNKRG